MLPDPEIQVDRQIPTMLQIVGHRFAEDVSSHSEIERYLTALDAATPFRTRLRKYGESYEGRAMWYLAISSAGNIERLEEIRSENLRLADPRKIDSAEAQEISARLPAIVWLGYTVHGNESSGSDAALLTAYHLLADRRAATQELLENVVVIIDPLQNPDGRDRFVSVYRETRGVFPQSDPVATEHTERWPGGRANHYLFDLNRDWFLQAQVESRARVTSFLHWRPHVFVDAHEMGRNGTYFFAPPAEPVSELFLPRQREWFDRIGRRHAERFDELGFSYTTREMFDAFYPGYGDSWPTLQGAIGILWEQAGARGLVVDRDDGLVLTYRDAVRHHYASGIATITAAAGSRKALVSDFHEVFKDTIRLGREGEVRDYFLLEGERPLRALSLARLLVRNGIEVRRVTEDVAVKGRRSVDGSVGERSAPAGSYHVPVAQPAGRLVRALLDRHVDMGDEFRARQLERAARRVPDEIYDITAWSLPLLHGVDCVASQVSAEVRSLLLDVDGEDPSRRSGIVGGPARVAYLVSAEGSTAPRALALWLREGLRVHVADQPLKTGGVRFPRGTLIVKVRDNPATLHDTVQRTTKALGLQAHARDSGYVDEGAHFGGPHVRWVKPPRVALVSDRPTRPSVGHTWYLLDRVLEYPVTRVSARNLGRLDLTRYDVLILPHGSYRSSSGFDESLAVKLRDWTSRGGTLVLVKGAASWAAGEEVGLLATRIVKQVVAKVDDGAKDEKVEEESPASVPGAILRASVYDDHWVSFGVDPRLDVAFSGNVVFAPVLPTRGRQIVTFVGREELLTSGFCWPGTLDLLAGKPYLIYQSLGRGHVVGFADDPNFRAASPTLQRLFFNAVLFGAGH